MRTQSRDTHPEAERVLIDLIRKAPIAKRFGLVRSTTASLLKANLRDIEKSFPDASPGEIAHQYLLRSRQTQWHAMAEALEIMLRTRQNWHIGNPDVLLALRSVVGILEKHHVTYYLGGSKVQGPHLNITYMEQWAERLNVASLLKQACDDAGLK